MNRLQYESSPYLLQHRNNPVDWFPWGTEALEKAKKEDKIILVSIGYAACHWCHVMERESFENEATAELMNKHFVNIKIDREERPDLDHIYMDAVQALSGSGGWPLNVFLTPDAKPFYGGTYYPPVRAFNRASWEEVLTGVQKAWQERRHEIIAQAEELTQHLANTSEIKPVKLQGVEAGNWFQKEQAVRIAENILKQADTEWGGYGQAPKFPQTATTGLLMQYYYFTGHREALNQALLTLDKIIAGGIHDHVGGGFARYSTDGEWLAPHFEKMLYDNALLLINLADAYKLTQKPVYRKTIYKTIEFLQREMKHQQGGYFAAIDADSEGVEGKFYVWQKEEVVNMLGNDAALFCDYFDITEAGNWEHQNILRVLKSIEVYAAENGLDQKELESKLDAGLLKLFQTRNKRVRPITDDKVLLGWNALLITALCKTAAALGDSKLTGLAIDLFTFLEEKFKNQSEPDSFFHTYKNGLAKYPAFLDDYAYLIESAIQLHELTANSRYLLRAEAITRHVQKQFSDSNQLFFYFTPATQADIVVNKTEIYDGATPSGNAVMAQNLVYLGTLLANAGWLERGMLMLKSLENPVTRYPVSFGCWGSLLLNLVAGFKELAIVGSDFETVNNQTLNLYFPNRVVQAAAAGLDEFPLLQGKTTVLGAQTLLYVCEQFACKAPLNSTGELVKYLQMSNKF